MSRQANLFFDLERSSPLLEGGTSNGMNSSISEAKKGQNENTEMKAEDQAGFVRKTFGLFSVQILFQLVYVLMIASEQQDGTKRRPTNKPGGIREFASNEITCALGVFISIVSVAYMVCNKSKNLPVNVYVGYLCWLLFTVGMTLLAGTMACRLNATKILAIEITTMVATLACTFFGGSFVKSAGVEKEAKKMGPTVAVLGLVLCTVIITCMALGIGGLKNRLVLSLFMLLVIGFFIMDIQFIVKGRYNVFDKDDYVLGSMKMFADFILIFSILASFFN